MENLIKYFILLVLIFSVGLNIYLLNKEPKVVIKYDYSEVNKLHEIYRLQQDSIINANNMQINLLEKNIKRLEYSINKIKNNAYDKVINNADNSTLDSLWKVAGI